MNARVDVGIPGMDEILHAEYLEETFSYCQKAPELEIHFGQQFLHAGFRLGEPGVPVTLEEHLIQVRINMDRFGWEPRKYEQEGKFAIVDAFTSGIGEAAKRELYVVCDLENVPSFQNNIRQA